MIISVHIQIGLFIILTFIKVKHIMDDRAFVSNAILQIIVKAVLVAWLFVSIIIFFFLTNLIILHLYLIKHNTTTFDFLVSRMNKKKKSKKEKAKKEKKKLKAKTKKISCSHLNPTHYFLRSGQGHC